jgi:hypothetical protein
MRKAACLFSLVTFSIAAFAQDTTFHYIKFLHVGQQIMMVHPLNISCGQGVVPRDSAELVNDTLQSVSIVTDKKSYTDLRYFMRWSDYHLVRNPGILDFGTFKMIADNYRYYVPGSSVTDYFKKMIGYLKKKKDDPQLIQGIINNYPWVFNP